VTTGDLATWLALVVRPLVTKAESVAVVEAYRCDAQLVLQVSVAPGDRGRLVGRNGATINGLRAVAAAVGGRHGFRVAVDLADETC
jgi:uncharacterized protein